MNKKLQQFVCLFFFFFTSLAYAQTQYTNFYFFGDSLSDIGNGTLDGGCLTNRDANTNECLTWANDIYFQTFGQYAKASSQGGTDYAVGGATSTDLAAQLNQYLQDHHNQVDPNASYFFLIGANDLMNIAHSTYTGVESTAETGHLIQAIGKVAETVGYYNNNLEKTEDLNNPGIVMNEMSTIQKLYDAGAQHIIVINLPDITTTPAVQTTINNFMNGCQKSIFVPKDDKPTCLTVGQSMFGLIDTFVRDFNGTLARRIALANFDPNRVKIYSMYDASQTALKSGKFNPGMCGGTAQECTGYLFFNDIHPGAAAQAMMAGQIKEML